MSTVPASRPAVKPAAARTPRAPRQRRPHVREVQCSPAARGTGADLFVQLWQDGKLFHYWLTRIPSDFGVAVRFEQGRANPERTEMQAESYAACVEPDRASCECPGHLRHGTVCKHIWAVRELLARGELAPRCPDPDELGEPCGQCFPDEPPYAAGASYKPGPDSDIPF
jgi:hypothetical protein